MSAHEKRVSYVLSTRNRADALSKALDNVREFIAPDDELIVMDGGSTDRTQDVIRKNADIVSVFCSEADCGIAHALNKGMLLSRGRYLANLTDDDYFYPDGIRLAVTFMEQHSEVDALVCGGEYCLQESDGTFRVLGYQRLPPGSRLCDGIANVFGNVVAGFLLLRRDVMARVGLFDTRLQASDTDYMVRLITSGVCFRYLDVKGFRLITHNQSSSLVNANKGDRDRFIIAAGSGAWDMAVSMGARQGVIAEALGLSGLAGGDDLTRVLTMATTCRASGRRGIKIIRYLVEAFMSARLCLWHVKRWFGPERGRASDETQKLCEPHWDGGLR